MSKAKSTDAETYSYRVKAVCSATVIETWTVTADRPLTEDAIREALTDGDAEGIDLCCTNEYIEDETDREVIEIRED